MSNFNYGRENSGSVGVLDEPTMAIEKVLYAAKVHTTGGRDGAARSSDGRIDLKLSSPGAPGSGLLPQCDGACRRQNEDQTSG